MNVARYFIDRRDAWHAEQRRMVVLRGADDPDIAVRGHYDVLSPIYGKRWDGTSWQEIGHRSAAGAGISALGGASRRPVVDVAADGTLFTAWWHEGERGDYIYAKSYSEFQWQSMGAGPVDQQMVPRPAGVSRPEMAVAPDGTPYLAWGGGSAHVTYWDGAIWSANLDPLQLSPPPGLHNRQREDAPKIAFDAQGSLYVVTSGSRAQQPTMNNLFVRRWDGTAWHEVGPNSIAGGGISDPDQTRTRGGVRDHAVAVGPTGDVFVVWVDDRASYRQLFVRQWDGTRWRPVGVDGTLNFGQR